MKPTAIIVDIDGTLAHMAGRSPYDPTKYHEDTVDEIIRDLIKNVEHEIILCSGRDDTYKDVTAKWLDANNVQYNHLFMRKAGDKREDSIVKEEIYLNDIEPRWKVVYVLDDRNRVVAMWRRNGLKCLQVAEGDF
jgi:uncharacterized HAD superfamily protein